MRKTRAYFHFDARGHAPPQFSHPNSISTHNETIEIVLNSLPTMDNDIDYEIFTEKLIFPDHNNNVTNSYVGLGPKRDSLYIVIPITVIYVIIFVAGLIGNVSTCVVIFRNKSMHTATNYYLFSLAISDLLLLVSGLPQEVFSMWSRYPYVFGQTFCLMRGLFSETSSNATVLTITAFTIERYMAICHPFLSHTMSKLSRAVKFILGIWIVAVFFAVPQAMQFGVAAMRHGDPETEMCHVVSVIIPHSFEFSTLVFFAAPMSLITVLYALIGLRLKSSNRMKKTSGDSTRSGNSIMGGDSMRMANVKHKQTQSSRRVLKMLVAVVVAFFVCWAPFHTQRLVAIYYTPSDEQHRQKHLKIYEVVTYISGILYYVSTTINPLLYNIMSNKFREAFKETFARWCGLSCLKPQRPPCTYSILARATHRGQDSPTDSARDDPSVQTHITIARKVSEDSMNAPCLGSRRFSSKRASEDLETGKATPIKHLQRICAHADSLGPKKTKGKSVSVQLNAPPPKRTKKLLDVLGWTSWRSNKNRFPGVHATPINHGSRFPIDNGQRPRRKRMLSSSSCDISNSSLKDVDNILLEDELTTYLKCIATE